MKLESMCTIGTLSLELRIRWPVLRTPTDGCLNRQEPAILKLPREEKLVSTQPLLASLTTKFSTVRVTSSISLGRVAILAARRTTHSARELSASHEARILSMRWCSTRAKNDSKLGQGLQFTTHMARRQLLDPARTTSNLPWSRRVTICH